MEYTEWERGTWHAWLRERGAAPLRISAGPHGDGRFETVGDVVKHIFLAEIRYVQRLTGQPLTEPSTIPNDNVEAIFEFAQQSRRALKGLLETFPAQEWDVMKEFKILNYEVKVTPRKIAIHIVMHEIRHWAQISTILRLQGMSVDFHDFLASP